MRFSFLKYLILVLLCFSSNSWGDENTIYISLGDHCPVAEFLRTHQLRNEAYPFDWNITPFNSLYKILNKDFRKFLLKKNLKKDSSKTIIDTYTGMSFIHDFPIKEIPIDPTQEENISGTVVGNYLEYYEKVNEKYQRRIARFRTVLNSNEKIIFLRNKATREEAIMLRNLIKIKYPSLDFRLIITNTSNYGTWKEENIKNFHVPVGSLLNYKSFEWLNVLNNIND